MMQENNNTHKGRFPKIAIVSDERYPKHTTNTQQVIKNASAFTFSGLPIELIIPLPLKGLFQSGYRLDKAIYQYYNIREDLKIKVLPTIPASKLRIEKFTHCFASVFYAWRKKFDLIYTRNETLALFCLLLGRPFIFETYRRFGHEFPKAMRWLAKRAHDRGLFGMVLHSDLAAQSMESVGISRDKMLVLHNGFDVADMRPMLSQAEARRALNVDSNAQIAVYVGNMQEGKGVESLIDLAAEMPDQQFWLVGGTEEDLIRLKAYAHNLKATNVHLPGWQPIGEVSKFLYMADVLLIPCTAAPLLEHGRTVLPFKVFPYLASGRPILAANTPDIKEILHHRENAMLVEPDHLTSSVQALKELFANAELRKYLSRNALETSRQL
ncbi:MAG: glycosyltransferase, partial [Bacteroidota bacterium]